MTEEERFKEQIKNLNQWLKQRAKLQFGNAFFMIFCDPDDAWDVYAQWHRCFIVLAQTDGPIDLWVNVPNSIDKLLENVRFFETFAVDYGPSDMFRTGSYLSEVKAIFQFYKHEPCEELDPAQLALKTFRTEPFTVGLVP